MRRISWLIVFTALVLSFPLQAKANSREIRIQAAVSSAFKFNPNWEKEIKDRLAYVNQIFEPAFKIHFSIEKYLSWDPEDETRETDLLMEELRSFIPLAPNQVVVGFHQMSQPFSKQNVLDYDTVGSAQFFKGYVLIRDPFGGLAENRRKVVLVHEMMHLFGAVHVAEEDAIMASNVPRLPTSVIDPDNRAIIQQTRDVDFQKELDSLSEEVIRKVIQIYEKLIRRFRHSDFYYQLGSFYEKLGQPARAIAVWEEARRYHFSNPYIHRALGFHYYENGRYGQAIQELGSAVSHYILPSQKKMRAETFNLLGVAYHQKGLQDQAVFNWLQGLTADPDNGILQGNLAIAYLQMGKIDRGVGELEKLVAKNPNDATVLSNLGVAMMRAGRFEEAPAYFKRALEKRTLDTGREKNEGAFSELMGEVSEAVIRRNWGGALLQMGSHEEAIKQLERSRALEAENYEVHRNLAQGYLMIQDYSRTISEAKAALKYKKDDPHLYAFLSQSYAESEDPQAALQAARDGLRYAKGALASQFHHNIALLYLRKNQFAQAKEELRVALAQHWNNANAHVDMGMIHLRQGDYADAKRSFQAALRIEPLHRRAREGLNSLRGKV